MNAIARVCTALILSLSLLPASVVPGVAADLVRGVYLHDPGVCGDGRVLGRISSLFDHQVRHVPNLPLVGIASFHNIRENRYLPAMKDRPIDRLYCQATVSLTDGYNRDIWYLVEWPMGFAGIGSNVEFCVLGFDRWNVYGGRCRVLR